MFIATNSSAIFPVFSSLPVIIVSSFSLDWKCSPILSVPDSATTFTSSTLNSPLKRESVVKCYYSIYAESPENFD
ncbi:MAG: hypothetical protein NDF54_12235 [archaeon GB-1867-035]|nr:hypothetical protein [Candidatus Culexmicrobium profundum]